MSYQARIAMPPLIVTGCTGACGKTKRTGPTASSSNASAMGTKSFPSAPRPCSTMTLAVGLGAGFEFDRVEWHGRFQVGESRLRVVQPVRGTGRSRWSAAHGR